jgi:hypothetical protein
MNLYRFGNNPKFFPILIEEDNGEIRTATVGVSKVVEHIAKKHITPNGSTRLVYAGGSSIPYKNPDGTLSERWTKII